MPLFSGQKKKRDTLPPPHEKKSQKLVHKTKKGLKNFLRAFGACVTKNKFVLDRATLWVVGEGVTVVEIRAVAAMDVVVVKTIALHFSLKKTCFFRDRAILYAIKKISKD